MADRTVRDAGWTKINGKETTAGASTKTGKITVVRGVQRTAGVLATSRAVDLACTRITVSVR
jgi:hypothetical protein